jgi:trehalose 2-sulfotransferase
MWGYFGDFVSLLGNIPAYRDLPLSELLPAVFPEAQFVRVVRANKVRQAVSLWKAVQTATWSEAEGAGPKDASPPYKSFLEEHRPGLRFHHRAIEHLLHQILVAGGVLGLLLRAHEDQAHPRALRELRR